MKHEPAEQLGITEAELQGLKRFVHEAETGVIREEQFTMKHFFPRYSPCGTACCFGGHLASYGVYIDDGFFDAAVWSDKLEPLYQPKGWRSKHFPLSSGIRAVRNFLAGAGPRCWNFEGAQRA